MEYGPVLKIWETFIILKKDLSLNTEISADEEQDCIIPTL